MLLMAEAKPRQSNMRSEGLFFRRRGQYTIFLHSRSERANFRLAERPESWHFLYSIKNGFHGLLKIEVITNVIKIVDNSIIYFFAKVKTCIALYSKPISTIFYPSVTTFSGNKSHFWIKNLGLIANGDGLIERLQNLVILTHFSIFL